MIGTQYHKTNRATYTIAHNGVLDVKYNSGRDEAPRRFMVLANTSQGQATLAFMKRTMENFNGRFRVVYRCPNDGKGYDLPIASRAFPWYSKRGQVTKDRALVICVLRK